MATGVYTGLDGTAAQQDAQPGRPFNAIRELAEMNELANNVRHQLRAMLGNAVDPEAKTDGVAQEPGVISLCAEVHARLLQCDLLARRLAELLGNL